MLTPFYANQFKRDLRKIEKAGKKDIEKLKTVIRLLIDGKPLYKSLKEHALTGNFKDRRECHIEADWLLVYKLNKQHKTIVFERTGSHTELLE